MNTTTNVDLDGALAEADANYVASNPKSHAQYDEALASMPGGNTRTVLFFPPFPLTIARGEGCRVWDADGHEYVDFLGEYTAGLYGHSNPTIMAALREALDGGIVLGGHTAMEAKLAGAVAARFPAMERLRFTNSGTEANLMAISTARVATGRSKVMVFDGGYHGGLLYFAAPNMPINAPFPYVKARYNDIDGTRKLIAEHGEDLACVILEPMLGSGGCIPSDPAFLAMLREETKRVGTLLIFDEVMTSRLGPSGWQGLSGVTPDLATLGKYIGGGLSFGAFGGRADLIDLYDPRKPDAIPHAGTFNNNALTMSAGFAGISKVYTEDLAPDFNARGDHLRERLNAIAQRHDAAMCFTGRGSMTAVHFSRTPPRNFDDVLAGRNELRPLLHKDLLASGVYAAARGMFVLSLPMTEAEFDALAEAVEEFVTTRGALLR
ncbi:MAG: aspartate aminotransferase family protein [Alphaproteobacteria bacterium]